MRITFLGHQGWQFENKNGHSFLLDPIAEEIGNGAMRLPIWPQRRLNFTKMMPIDAVVISHEHADHFSLETLMALPTRCRVYVSDLASSAITGAIRELGFQVERFAPLEPFLISGIKLTALPALYNRLEPDVYALLMQDGTGASFLTAIDTVTHPGIAAWLAQNCPRRTLDNLTNNFVEARQPLVSGEWSHEKSRAAVTATMREFVQQFAPRRAVVSGQGWCFKGDKTPFNHSFFSVDNAWLTQAARQYAPQTDWIEGRPGLCLDLRGQNMTVKRSDVMTPAVDADRSFDIESVKVPEPFAPWTGIRALGADRLVAVEQFVRERFGQVLGGCAPTLMESLYYLKFHDCDTFKPTLAIVLRDGDARRTFEFDYGHLGFVEARSHRRAACGFEIWASDLELLIAAQEEAFLVYESAVRSWSHVPSLINTAALIECFMWFTPRFRAQETLAFYRARIAAMRAAPGGASSFPPIRSA